MAIMIGTFVDGDWIGYLRISDITKIKESCHTAAVLKQHIEKADHMIYGHYEIDDDGEVVIARLYSGFPKTYIEFDALAAMKHC